MIQPNYQASIEFLRRVHPSRKWVLSSLAPDQQGMNTATFDASTEAQCLQWLEREGRTRNIYWSVGEPIGDVSKKLERTDISRVHYFHVDIDPRAGEDVATDQKRILNLLTGDKLPGKLPAPTIITFSGGGYQGFWELDKPIEINGDLTKAEDTKLFNLFIEQRLGADHCHDISRIMRLPGTINRPDAKKRAKGRVEALAELVAFNDNAYGLDRFTKALPPKGSTGDKPAANPALKTRVDLASLPKTVSDKCKATIMAGHDIHDPSKFGNPPDRSKWLFYVVCELVRAGVDDQTIFNIITDPANAISASVIDKGSRSDKYANRQIQRAHDTVGEDVVSRINRDYFAALEGKKVLYFREEDDNTLTAMNAEAFSFEVAPIKQPFTDAKGNTREMDGLPIWRDSTRRRYYGRGFVLDPSYAHGDDQYNLWKGFGVQPAPGDWRLMHRHIVEVLANGNEAYADYIIRWAAWKFQHPAAVPRVALVFRGGEGTGKGVFARAVMTAFGVHGQQISQAEQFTGRFNNHIRHCCLLYADEMQLVEQGNDGKLKTMITEPTIAIEAKGVDIVHIHNHLGIIMASNQDFFLPAGEGARRFAMFDVSAAHQKDNDYFTPLYAEIEAGGIGAMVYDLLKMDLGKWHPETARPDTAALDSQKASNLPPLERCLLQCLESGELPCGQEQSGDTVFLPSEVFVDLINNRLKLRDKEQVSTTKLYKLFTRLGFVKFDKSRPRGWFIPPLPDARKVWNEKMSMKVEWDKVTEWHAYSISMEKMLKDASDNDDQRYAAYMAGSEAQAQLPF
jgi:hypothetical protein